MRSALLLALLVLLAPPLRAQGADACSAAQAIAGTGLFAFDTSAATTGSEGQGAGECFAYGLLGIERDVWFAWTSPQGGWMTLSTCGLTDVDTKIAIFHGPGCPISPPLGCSEDACAFQSRIDFFAFANTVYTIQIGSFPGAPGGAGSFSLEYVPPPPLCSTAQGPNVVLGQVTNVFNAPAEGGIDALAIGSTACNVGTLPLDWDGSVGASPALRQNLFRYSVVDGASRFEQVGMSWLKHGFFAVQQSFCCACLAEPGTTRLGVGCADTYVAGINAAQAFLTPNWEVDAHAGVLPHPPSDPPWSGNVARRLQVAVADLAPTGGPGAPRYVAEGLYVARDDALAGNADDNASWRELSVAGGPSDFDLDVAPGAQTQRAHPAIRAWRKLDPEVRYAEVEVPGDGVLVVCWRVTALAGRRWRYEYAVCNRNADRSVGAFSVPVPAEAGVSGIGFHDVDYHSGDGPGGVDLDGADWTPTLSGGALSWACEGFGANASANALRWGTLYNFRFDAERPPRPASATLGLWKPGTPARVEVEVEAPAAIVEAFCAGDGSLRPCPCQNSGAPGRGCENSAATGGASLEAGGTPSIAADDLVLTASGMPGSVLAIHFTGRREIAAREFGDGLRCVGSPLRRLYVGLSLGGVHSAPAPGQLSITSRMSALGAPIAPGETHLYQTRYRDDLEGFCPDALGGRFNATSGLRILWGG